MHLVVLYLPLCNTFQVIVVWEPRSLSWLVVSFRNSWEDLDLNDNENVWGEEVQYKFLYDAYCSWWTICGTLETNWDKWRLPVDFCRLDRPGESASAVLILSSLAMKMNVRHYAWSAMTTIFALRKCWRILKSHALTESEGLRFSSSKSPFSPDPSLSLLISPFPLSLLCLLSLHLRIWFVMVTERGDRKKMFTSGKKNVSNVS